MDGAEWGVRVCDGKQGKRSFKMLEAGKRAWINF
jgi:hypothetical protein